MLCPGTVLGISSGSFWRSEMDVSLGFEKNTSTSGFVNNARNPNALLLSTGQAHDAVCAIINFLFSARVGIIISSISISTSHWQHFANVLHMDSCHISLPPPIIVPLKSILYEMQFLLEPKSLRLVVFL